MLPIVAELLKLLYYVTRKVLLRGQHRITTNCIKHKEEKFIPETFSSHLITSKTNNVKINLSLYHQSITLNESHDVNL
jgi:hypothetical protein